MLIHCVRVRWLVIRIQESSFHPEYFLIIIFIIPANPPKHNKVFKPMNSVLEEGSGALLVKVTKPFYTTLQLLKILCQ